MRQFSLVIIILGFIACKPASTADVDRDGKTDILIKGNKAKDANIDDNIFIVDNIVVNAVTNDQWKAVDGNLAVVNTPTFTMKFDPDNKKWNKISIQQ